MFSGSTFIIFVSVTSVSIPDRVLGVFRRGGSVEAWLLLDIVSIPDRVLGVFRLVSSDIPVNVLRFNP